MRGRRKRRGKAGEGGGRGVKGLFVEKVVVVGEGMLRVETV